MTCIFGSASQWATVRLIAPAIFGRIARYEEQFGGTIQRRRSIRDLAAQGRPYQAAIDHPELVGLALGNTWSLPILGSPQSWSSRPVPSVKPLVRPDPVRESARLLHLPNIIGGEYGMARLRASPDAESPAQYLSREHSFDGESECQEVLDAARRGGAVYMAIRRTIKAGPSAGRSYVFCGVILVFNNKRDGFGRKSMSESSGPCEVDCPERIFRLLSPIPNPGYAADWRARVKARRQPPNVLSRLRPGQRIRLAQPITFDGGRVSADEFELAPTPPRRRGPIFRPVGHDFLCRLSRDLLANALAVDVAAVSEQPGGQS